MSSRSSGAVLPDLLAALVLFGMLGLLAVRGVVQGERVARAVLSHGEAQVALGGGLDFIRHELAEVGRDSASTDLLMLSRDSLAYRAMRYAGLACRVGATSVVLRADQAAGWRLPQPGRDSLLVLVAPDSGPVGPAGWIAGPIRGVGGGSCGTQPAITLSTVLDSGRLGSQRQPALVPVRIFEVMQLRAYSSLGSLWLGARSLANGEAIQPVQGPLGSPGLSIAAYDSAARPTVSPGAVRRLEIALAASWSGWRLAPGIAAGDSVTMRLVPRNLGP
jgi:hypothetical protein